MLMIIFNRCSGIPHGTTTSSNSYEDIEASCSSNSQSRHHNQQSHQQQYHGNVKGEKRKHQPIVTAHLSSYGAAEEVSLLEEDPVVSKVIMR